MQGVAISPRKEVGEDLELRHLMARIEAKFCLFSLASFTTVELVGDYQDNLEELKELTEEVMVRMQEKVEESGVGRVDEWRKRMLTAKEKLVKYMSDMRRKEKILMSEDFNYASVTVGEMKQAKEEVKESVSVVKRSSAEESTKEEEKDKLTRLEDKAPPSPYPKRVKSMPQKYCDEDLKTVTAAENVEEKNKTSKGKSKMKKRKPVESAMAAETSKKSRIKGFDAEDALSNQVERAESEARAGRCCLCGFTAGLNIYHRRRAVLMHQARKHFRQQVRSILTDRCPSCSYTPVPSPSHCYSPSSKRVVLLQHWASVHPTLLTWVQATYNRLEEEKKAEEDTGSDEEDDIRITEIEVKDI